MPDELTAAILVRPLDARAQGSALVPEAMPFDIPYGTPIVDGKLRRDREVSVTLRRRMARPQKPYRMR